MRTGTAMPPAFHYVEGDANSAHDLDALGRPLHEAITRISCENSKAEILINVTASTPQMQMILSQIAMEMRYHGNALSREGRSGQLF